MIRQNLEKLIFDFLDKEVLEGESEDLTPETPLLEWGLLDSMAMAKLVSMLQQECSIKIPGHELVPGNFESIQAISGFVLSLKESGGQS